VKYYKGADFRLQIYNTVSEAWSGDYCERSLVTSFSLDSIEVTSKHTAWKTRLDAAGVRSFSFKCSGVFSDSLDIVFIKSALFNGHLVQFRVLDSDGVWCSGYAQIKSVSRVGEYNDAELFDFLLVSSGEVVAGEPSSQAIYRIGYALLSFGIVTILDDGILKTSGTDRTTDLRTTEPQTNAGPMAIQPLTSYEVQ